MRLSKLVVGGILSLAVLTSTRLDSKAAAETCPRLEDVGYVGSKSCQKCHFKEYSSWSKTKMALAFNSLKPNAAGDSRAKAKLDAGKDYTKEAGCVKCHVTGYGKPGGYPAVDHDWTAEEKARAPLLEGVGCESCHGPGEKYSVYKKDNKEYKWADLVKLGAVHTTEANCATCHSKDSPTFVPFNFAEKIGKDTHEVPKLKYNHDCDHPHGGK